jgi:hypothetical protein
MSSIWVRTNASRFGREEVGGEARFDPLDVADLRSETLHQPSFALSDSHVVGAHVASDSHEPRHHTSITAERAYRADRTQVRLLHQILDVAVGTQCMAQLPHVGLGQGDELDEGRSISLDRTSDHLTKDSVRGHQRKVPDGRLA